jgi:DNA-binding transcriptional regulator YhcF (GntR family)
MDHASMDVPPEPGRGESGLSYKFQRLREKLRQAVASGELSGKLPGERTLARRFHVNAKTLSKALTDLAAEGLLDRSIGRGTYVKGYSPGGVAKRRWLLVCDAECAAEQMSAPVMELLREAHPDAEIIADVAAIRPSFLNQFGAVIDFSASTPEEFLRDMVVRNIPVVVVGREPRVYSTHAVVFDVALAASQIGRDLVLAGHRRLAAVEARHSRLVADALARAAARYSPDVQVDTCFPADLQSLVEDGVSAVVCQNLRLADQVKCELDRLGVAVPARVSVLALGATNDKQTVSGYFLPAAEKARAILQLLNDPRATRPTMLWLAGQYVDRGTVSARSVAG